MYCSSCGAKNGDDANYCKQCGTGLARPASTKISEQDFERAMPEDDRVAALLERAYRARKDGNREEAIATCLEALTLRPASTSCHSLLSQLYEQGGDQELAVLHLEKVLELNPGSIADRVKLDEMRGDVPALITEPRRSPQIVLADRSKAAAPFDYRVAGLVVGCAALLALGGIFALQLQDRQTNRTHNQPVVKASTTGADNAQSQQTNQVPNSSSGQQPGAPNLSNSSNSTPGFTQQGAIPQGPQSSGGYFPQTSPGPNFSGISQPPANAEPGPKIGPMPGFSQPGTAAPVPSRTTQVQQGNSASQKPLVSTSDPDQGTERVRLSVGDQGQGPGTGSIRLSSPTGQSPSPSPSTGDNTAIREASGQSSQSREFTARASNLEMQQQYKQACNLYLRALDGAGDEAAYIYSRAARCFRSIGDKNSAISNYQHGVDEAQKLVASGHQAETARNLIRECESGIKICSN